MPPLLPYAKPNFSARSTLQRVSIRLSTPKAGTTTFQPLRSISRAASRKFAAPQDHPEGLRRSAAAFDFSEGEEDGAFGDHLLARLRGGAGLRGRYDAVLIDEAQDWPCSWFQCARLALKEPETGDLMIVGDGSQSLYRKRDFTWADAGIHASGRVINRKFDLDRNYRNTAEILRAARTFSVPPASGMEGVLALPVEPDTAIRCGPEDRKSVV